MRDGSKVFCIGFHKTGTTSLYAALRELGLAVTGTVGERWSADRLARDGAEYCVEIAQRFDAAEDMPWPLFFRELDAAFPDSKFILTIRDPEDWFASIDSHFGCAETEMHAFIYGREKARARDQKGHWIDVMMKHNSDVRDYFSDRPNDLLIMNLAEGDGWIELASFLGAPPPDTPFPQKNTSADRESFAYRLKKKLNEMIGRSPLPERLA